MNILIDVNVVVDIFLNRDNFGEESLKAVQLASHLGDTIYFSAGSFAILHYVVSKKLVKSDTRHEKF